MKIKDIKTPGELYSEMMGATTPLERDHHGSDLYIKVTSATMRIVDRYKFSSQVSSFRDQTDPHCALWYDIPFAYLPYWEGQRD